MARKKNKLSIDSIVRFKHNGEMVKVRVMSTKFTGGKLHYQWERMDGKTPFWTEGLPKFKIVEGVYDK